MVGMARSNFPSLPTFPTTQSMKIPAQVLRTMIAKTIFAISNEESRYTLNGALMVLKPESIIMVATDGHRLAHIERNGEKFEGISGELKTLVPKKAMAELSTLLGSTDADFVEFAKDEANLLVSSRITKPFYPRTPASPWWFAPTTSAPRSNVSPSLPTSALVPSAYAWTRTRSKSRRLPLKPENPKTLWKPPITVRR
jgi:hypothetical protein